jgi:lysophospholipase L1-like esterase
MTNNTNTRWVGSWATTMAPTDGITLGGQTIRMMARVSIGGSTIRVRISNAYGLQKLRVGAATIALRDEAAKIVPGSLQKLSFDGASATTIGIGALAVSDPLDFPLPALGDVAVSVYLPDDIGEDFQVTGHGNARQTNYFSPPGDHTQDTDLAGETTEANLFVSAIDVVAPAKTGGIVTLGDSLTDSNISTVDAHYRWPDQLARRLVARHEDDGGRLLGVINQGIGGNRVLHDQRGDSCLRRFDRDVIAQPGVTHAIVFLGINDIRNRHKLPGEEVTAAQMIAGFNQLAMRGRAAGITMYVGTLLPYEGENYNPPPGLTGLYTEEGEAVRQEINGWIRTQKAYDGVIDFDEALRDPGHPTQMFPEYDCGDHLHPGDAGYLHMGDVIDLSLFD